MAYKSLDSFSKSWIFRREDPKVSEQDLAAIRLQDDARSAGTWRDYISDNQLHPDHFTEKDWLENSDLQIAKIQWEKVWDSASPHLPDELLEHVESWGDDTTVFFCCDSELVFEMPWAVFKRTWKTFLFLDNGPVLVAKKKKQAVQFHSNGMATLLLRG